MGNAYVVIGSNCQYWKYSKLLSTTMRLMPDLQNYNDLFFHLMDKRNNFVILLCILQQDTSRKTYYFYCYCYRGLSISFSMVPPLLPFRRHTFPFIASSDVKFLCFITLSTFPTFLQVVIVVVFLPVARSLFAYAICYPP